MLLPLDYSGPQHRLTPQVGMIVLLVTADAAYYENFSCTIWDRESHCPGWSIVQAFYDGNRDSTILAHQFGLPGFWPYVRRALLKNSLCCIC